MAERTFFIATRGSPLALSQANSVLAECRAAFPQRTFELAIIKTTGDKLQTPSLAQAANSLPKGLFTKELEVALLEGRADLAVHSLKDLPTEVPAGLKLGAVCKRADVRDLLIYRNESFKVENAGRRFAAGMLIKHLPPEATVATSSTRRRAQLLLGNPRLNVVEIRGNVLTRIVKLAENPKLDAIVLAVAGVSRLNYRLTPEGVFEGASVPEGLAATLLEPEVMLPCVGQGAIGIEARVEDELAGEICARLNDYVTMQCVTAERAFLAAMGGGCQSPVAAYAQSVEKELWMRARSFVNGRDIRAEGKRPLAEALELGQQLAAKLKDS